MIGFSEFLDYYYAIITYKFADGHTEEIEVTDEVAAAFEQLEKYEKKVERKETRRHISYDKLLDSGFEFPDESEDILDILDKEEQEKSEWKEEKFRRHNIDGKKQEIFSLLTYRQADAFFRQGNLLKKPKPTCKSINWRTIKRSSCWKRFSALFYRGTIFSPLMAIL